MAVAVNNLGKPAPLGIGKKAVEASVNFQCMSVTMA
jgi:hypothetical protein